MAGCENYVALTCQTFSFTWWGCVRLCSPSGSPYAQDISWIVLACQPQSHLWGYKVRAVVPIGIPSWTGSPTGNQCLFNWKAWSLFYNHSRTTIVELEMLAVVWAGCNNCIYLNGSKFEFITDHFPLVTAINFDLLDQIENPHLLRMQLKIIISIAA